MSKVVVTLDKKGTLTTYNLRRNGSIIPNVSVHLNGGIVKTFPKAVRTLASLQEKSAFFIVLEAKWVPKKPAKLKARRKT